MVSPACYQYLNEANVITVNNFLISDLWIMGAKWEFEENKNIPNSRTLLQRGLRVNPSSKQLWLEVSIELQ